MVINLDMDKLGKESYTLYCSLINGGFTQGHALGLVSQFIAHCWMQGKLQEAQEFERIIDKKGE